MANEAVEVEGPYEVHDFTVADGVTISGLTLCKLTDPRTASASGAIDDVFAGIAATEKKANSGATNLGLYTTGTFELIAEAGTDTISGGRLVCISGVNLIRIGVAGDLLTGAAFGRAIEDIAAGLSGEVMLGL